MKRAFRPFIENFAESGTACLLTMVQANVLALGLGHWLIASRTGFFAGAAATAAFVVIRNQSRWVIAGTLALATAVVDYLVHPGRFGPVAMEAIVTGVGAGVLSLVVGAWKRRRRSRLETAG